LGSPPGLLPHINAKTQSARLLQGKVKKGLRSFGERRQLRVQTKEETGLYYLLEL
jgi:hypothetical protein